MSSLSSDASTVDTGFDALADLFWQLGVMQSPSQLQGLLLGLLAVSADLDLESWLLQAHQLLDPVRPLEQQENALLATLLDSHRQLLDKDDLDLQLLLPDDAAELNLRIEALGQWCQGFLLGFAQAGKQLQQQQGTQQYSNEISETLSDMAAISQVEIDGELDVQQSEQQLFEVSEYVRLAAISVAMECRQISQQSAIPNSQSDKKLH